MNVPPRNKYQIKVVCRQSAPAESSWKDVLSTSIVTTRTGMVDLAASLQKIYPKPEHRVLVHLLGCPDQPREIAWEIPEIPGNGRG